MSVWGSLFHRKHSLPALKDDVRRFRRNREEALSARQTLILFSLLQIQHFSSEKILKKDSTLHDAFMFVTARQEEKTRERNVRDLFCDTRLTRTLRRRSFTRFAFCTSLLLVSPDSVCRIRCARFLHTHALFSLGAPLCSCSRSRGKSLGEIFFPVY